LNFHWIGALPTIFLRHINDKKKDLRFQRQYKVGL
jgi:hypothetical protein